VKVRGERKGEKGKRVRGEKEKRGRGEEEG
jgi:hypothetical protein